MTLLDRTLIWDQRHLLHALREFEQFYNGHRPHQGIANARTLRSPPAPIVDRVVALRNGEIAFSEPADAVDAVGAFLAAEDA